MQERRNQQDAGQPIDEIADGKTVAGEVVAARAFQNRIDRAAEEAAAWQGLKNLIRRLLGLPVVVTAEQARQKERARWGADT